MENFTIITATKEFNEFIDKNNIEAEFCFSFDLPYELQICPKHYYFESTENMFKLLNNRKRNIVIEVKRNWNVDQATALRHSTFQLGEGGYGFINTSLNILVESFNDEIDDIRKIYANDKDKFIRDLMQSVMEYFIFKYDESLGGNHFISPSSYDCSRIAFFYFKQKCWSDKEELEGMISLNPNHRNINYVKDDFKQNLNNRFSIWKLFFNKSKYSYEVYDYIDSIISAAISIESYFYDIIQSNVDLDKKSDYIGENETFKPTHKIAKILYDNGYISKRISKTNMNKLIMKILKPRNDIMHGRLETPLGLNNIAKDVNSAIIEFYEKFENIK